MGSRRGEARGRPLRDLNALLAKGMSPAAAALNARLLGLLEAAFPDGAPYQRLAELEGEPEETRTKWTKNLSERLSHRKRNGADWDTVELIVRHAVPAVRREQQRQELADLWEDSWGYRPVPADATAGDGTQPAEPAGPGGTATAGPAPTEQAADNPLADDPVADDPVADDVERIDLVGELSQAHDRIAQLTAQLTSSADEARDSRAQLLSARAEQVGVEMELANTRELYARLVGDIQLHPDAAEHMAPLPDGAQPTAAATNNPAPVPARALGAYLEAWATFRHLTTAVVATSGGGSTEIVERLYAGLHLPAFPLVACIARIVGADLAHTEKLYMNAELYTEPNEATLLARSGTVDAGTSTTAEALAIDPATVTATFAAIVSTSLADTPPLAGPPTTPTTGSNDPHGPDGETPGAAAATVGRYHGRHRAQRSRPTPTSPGTLRERLLLPVGVLMAGVLLATALVPVLAIAWMDSDVIALQYASGDRPYSLNIARLGHDDLYEWSLLPGQTASTVLHPTRAGRAGHLHGDLGSVQFTVLSCPVQMEWLISSGNTVLSHGSITSTAQTIELADVLSPAITPNTPLRLTVTRTDWMPCRTALRWTHAGITSRPVTPPLSPRQLQH